MGLIINPISNIIIGNLNSSDKKAKKALPKKITALLKRANKLAEDQNPEFYSIASEVLFLSLEKYTGSNLSAFSKKEREYKLQELKIDNTLIERINTIHDRILMVKYSGTSSVPFREDLKELHKIIEDLL